jgi:hypothetical protein
MIQDNLELPFETQILDVRAIVERVDMNEAEEIIAICRRSGKRQAIPILSLSLPMPPPQGAEWIEAYRHWSRGA